MNTVEWVVAGVIVTALTLGTIIELFVLL